MFNLSPVKKIILAIAAMCIAVSVIAANNLSTIMIFVAARNIQNGTVQASGSGSGEGNDAPGEQSETGGTEGALTGTDVGTETDKTTAEIVEMYNTAINNAKANASSIVRVKDGAINYKGIVRAGNLSSVASTLMGLFMVSSPSEIEAKNEAWDADRFPPEGAKAALTEAGIKSAVCKEDGDYYILTIVANDETNPKSGGPGVGSLCGVIQEETITGSISSVPGLELNNISIDYENVAVVAKIEKATGNIVNLQLDAPCVLSLDAKVPILGSIDDAAVGIEVITEYNIEY